MLKFGTGELETNRCQGLGGQSSLTDILQDLSRGRHHAQKLAGCTIRLVLESDKEKDASTWLCFSVKIWPPSQQIIVRANFAEVWDSSQLAQSREGGRHT